MCRQGTPEQFIDLIEIENSKIYSIDGSGPIQVLRLIIESEKMGKNLSF